MIHIVIRSLMLFFLSHRRKFMMKEKVVEAVGK